MITFLESAGQWDPPGRQAFTRGVPKEYSFDVLKEGWHCLYIANEDDQHRPTFEFFCNGYTRTAGGLCPKQIFWLKPGRHTAAITCRDNTLVKVMFYASTMGVNYKNVPK